MRICLISREFAPYFGAGIGTYAASWARALAAEGHEVHILSRDHPGRAGSLIEDGPLRFPGVRFHAVDPTLGPPKLDHNYPYARNSLAVLAALRRLHEKHPFDVIEYPEYWAEGHAVSQAHRTLDAFAPAVLVCRLHTSSARCRELDADETYPHYAAYLDIMEHESIAYADVVLSPSTDLLRMTGEAIRDRRWGPGLPDAAVMRYPFDGFGIDGSAPVETSAPDRDTDEPEILCLGRLERRKGQDVLIEAMAALDARGWRCRLTLAGGDTGSGPFGRSMRTVLTERLPAAWRDRVRFLGPVPRDGVGELIADADVCVFPARWDNFPNALLEAMWQGAAVVSTDAGGPGEIIQDGRSGLLCPPESPEALAGAIESALADPGTRQRLGAGARRRVETLCDPAGVVRAFEGHIERVRTARNRPIGQLIRDRSTVHESDTEDQVPEVSVIVPHYNLPAYLPETLASIRSQTFKNLEIIIVDDGSTVAEAEPVLEQAEAEGARIIRRGNGGLSAARNTGIDAARGRYVLPVDADDVLSPTFIEKAVRVLRAEPDLACVTALVSYFREDRRGGFAAWVPVGLHRDLLPIHNCAGCCMAVFRREAIDAVHGYSTELTAYEDWDVYCSLAERDERSAVIPEFLLHYRIRDDSLLRTAAEVRKQHLHAAVLARHPALPLDPTRVTRTMLSEKMEAANIGKAGLRYRVADRLNLALKRSPLHSAIKGLAERTIEAHRARRRDG
ncbi:MAG: glycosyltransferase [Planctomycetota bacterium]